MKIDIEKHKAYLNSEEGKAYLEKEKEEIEAKEQEQKEIITGDEYMLWLEHFTVENLSFSDDDWLYFPEDINEEDEEKVNKLNLLYRGIERYANANYIYPKTFDFGNSYFIKFNDIGYEISMMYGQGISFGCGRVDIENEDDFIDFRDIKNSKRQPNSDAINQKLEELSSLILQMVEDNVPIEAIQATSNGTIQKILKKVGQK